MGTAALDKLLRTAIEHAAAQRGLFYLGESVKSTPTPPESVLRSVVRTHRAHVTTRSASSSRDRRLR
jgi:hypothetical protein